MKYQLQYWTSSRILHFFLKQRPNALGRLSIGPIMKCTSVIGQLAYNTSPDAFDEYLQIGEHCSRDCLLNAYKLFTHREVFFFRKPDLNDIHARGVDCMHWEWIKCLKALQGQFKKCDDKHPAVVLDCAYIS